jgi:hypothetical protein
MELMTRAEYARRRGVSRQAITRFVQAWAIPTHGPRGLIDAAALDRLYVPRVDAGPRPACGQRRPTLRADRR